MAEKEYIEAKQVLSILNDLVNDTPDKEEFYNRVFEEVDAMRAADVVPRAEVAREIFAEIEELLRGWFDHFRQGDDMRESCAIMAALSQVTELKKKYTEDES